MFACGAGPDVSSWSASAIALNVASVRPAIGRVKNRSTNVAKPGMAGAKSCAISILVPIVAMAVGVSAIGEHIEEGTIVYASPRPIRRRANELQMVEMRERMVDLLHDATGQPREKLVVYLDRDFILRGPDAVAPATAMKIERLVRASEHKRRLPPIFEPES